MAKDILENIDPEMREELLAVMKNCAAVGKVTWKQIRESGMKGRKYPYDQVAQAINALPEAEITEKNINRIIRDGWIWSGRVPGPKKLSQMVLNPLAKEIVSKD